MDKYRRIAKEKSTKETPEDEIRVTATGRTATYVTYAAKLFNEKKLDKCTIKATGTALPTAVTLVEIIKRRFKGLHQITNLGSTDIVDEYEPLEEGLDKVTDVRQVSFIEITLSKKELDKKNNGYQVPISEDLVKEFSPEEMSRGRSGRGGRRFGNYGKGKGQDYSRNQDDKGKGKGNMSRGKDNKGKGRGDYDNYGWYGDSYGYSNYRSYGYGPKGGKGKSFGFEDKGGKKGKGKGGKSKGGF